MRFHVFGPPSGIPEKHNEAKVLLLVARNGF